MIDRLEIEMKLPPTVSRENAMVVSEECYDRYFFDTIDKVVSRYSTLYDFDIDSIKIDLGKISQDNIPSALEALLIKAIEEKLFRNPSAKLNDLILQDSGSFDEETEIDTKLSLYSTVWKYLRKGLISYELESLFQYADKINESYLGKGDFDAKTSHLSLKKEDSDRYVGDSSDDDSSDISLLHLQIEHILADNNYDVIIDLIKSDKLVLFRLANIVTKDFLLRLTNVLIEKTEGRLSHEIAVWAEKNLEKESVSAIVFMLLDEDECVVRLQESIRKNDFDLKKQLLEFYHSVFESRLLLFDEDQEVKEKRFHLEDAGLVLLAPFISTLFSRLGYLDESGCFASVAIQFRAIVLLKKIVFPEKEKVHDYELNLCKVLCGVNPAFPIPSDIELTGEEKTEIKNLLESVIDYWTIIKGTSVDGFRESFLKRFGTLEKSENMWIVRVEGATIDILMEDLPWSFSALSYSWSREVIYVEWQKPL